MGLYDILMSLGVGLAVGLVARWLIFWHANRARRQLSNEPLQIDPYVHPLNAPGDFYVMNQLCIACKAPEHEAPDLMSHGDESQGYHCYFKRQPETPEEIERACRAVEVGCCESVRYGGRDPQILARLSEFGRGACDHAEEEP